MGDVSRAGEEPRYDRSDRFVVYADFNCPFCFALNERLHAMDLDHRVEFRCIENFPSASSDTADFDLLAALTGEVAELRRRAPSIQINLPLFRPNTAAAVDLANRVYLSDPVQAARLRRGIFRALWIDGQDISRPAVLETLLEDLEIEVPDTAEAGAPDWRREWDSQPEFDHSIPILLSARGETVVGFPLEPELTAFLETGSMVSDLPTSPLAGAAGDRQRILVLDNDADTLRMVIEQVPEAQIEVVRDFTGLVVPALNNGVPDLVLANTALLGGVSSVDWWRESAASDLDGALPVIFVSSDASTEAEVAAFEAGAADFIARPLHPRVLRARIRTHLRARRTQSQLKNIARIDALTSICNRREFDLRLLSEWGRGARSGLPLAVLMIDVDQFKEYNDQHGHLRGDDCLVKVAQVLSNCVQRAGDLIARYGGEEFVILLPGVDLDGAGSVADACLDALREARIPHSASSVSPYLSISIGVAALQPAHDKSCTVLVEQADIALYQAKQEGRNRACLFAAD
jgi:diguanylate cyclase (GGDEF)-like protein